MCGGYAAVLIEGDSVLTICLKADLVFIDNLI
jgi:hypothetical protein